MKKLYLYYGLPGSGKTTAALKLCDNLKQYNQDVKHFEADMYFTHDGKYEWDAEHIGDAHKWCQEAAKKALKDGYDVVVSNTSLTPAERLPYVLMAINTGCDLVVKQCTGEYENVHNVPAECMTKMREKLVPYTKTEMYMAKIMRTVDWSNFSVDSFDDNFFDTYKTMIDWYSIDYYNVTEEFVIKYADYVDWDCLSYENAFSNEFLLKYACAIDWEGYFIKHEVDFNIIKQLSDVIPWDNLVYCPNIPEDYIINNFCEFSSNSILRFCSDPREAVRAKAMKLAIKLNILDV